jgi:hypothetical protein
MGVPVLMYGSENWTINRLGKQKIVSAEMRSLRPTVWRTLKDQEKNEHLWKKLRIFNLTGKIQDHEMICWCEQYQDRWWPINVHDNEIRVDHR